MCHDNLNCNPGFVMRQCLPNVANVIHVLFVKDYQLSRAGLETIADVQSKIDDTANSLAPVYALSTELRAAIDAMPDSIRAELLALIRGNSQAE